MPSSNVINVFYHNKPVGRLAMTHDRLCAFEYDAEWLVSGFAISPFKLPLEKKVFIAPREPFDGGFGVFSDSLPDGWGRLLIDRMLIKNRINPASLSYLERLAIVGTSGMGALEFKPENILSTAKISDNLDDLARECEKILNDEYDGNLEELVKAGGSSGGARPKVLIQYEGEDWIIKFRSSEDPKNMGEMEYKYSLAAKKAGLIMPETKLFEGKYFGVKRFDRKANGEKVHMISAGGLMDASHRYPTIDYVDLMKAILVLTKDFSEVEKMFRLMCFNVFAHNMDDHVKNFSFIYDNEKWQVSPAYDLVYASGMGGEHATAIAGEGRDPDVENIMSVAKETGLSNHKAKIVIDEVKTAVHSSLKEFLKIKNS